MERQTSSGLRIIVFIVDTNVISELRKRRPHGAVVDWMSETGEAGLYLSAVSVGEIQIGIERTRGNDPAKAAEIESWLSDLFRAMKILPVTGDTFRIWGRLMHRKQVHLWEDALIAATAIQHNATVATRNIRDFKIFDVPVLNPFNDATDRR